MLKYEHGVEKNVGLGINFALMDNTISFTETNTDSAGKDYAYNAKLSCNTISILARFNYHFGTTEKLDPYLGVGLGYRGLKWKYSDNDPLGKDNSTSYDLSNLGFPLGMDMTIGMRYMIHPNIGLYMEAGMAKGVLQGGLNFSF